MVVRNIFIEKRKKKRVIFIFLYKFIRIFVHYFTNNPTHASLFNQKIGTDGALPVPDRMT